MENEFVIYKRFDDAALADAVTAVLEKHDIDYRVEENSTTINPLAAMGNELQHEYVITIHPEDFIMANQALTQEEQEDINAIGQDYYLFAFTNDELTDVIAKPDEWSHFDSQLAKKILIGRGVSIDESMLLAMHHHPMNDLSEPEPKQTTWIIIGYITALLGGVLGIFIGWHLSHHTKTLPNGKNVYGYSEADRQQGKQIFYLGIVMLTVSVAYRIYITI